MFFMSYSLHPAGKSDSRDWSRSGEQVGSILFGRLHRVAAIRVRVFALALSTKPRFEHTQLAHCL